jgi:hypothetical protein
LPRAAWGKKTVKRAGNYQLADVRFVTVDNLFGGLDIKTVNIFGLFDD